MESGYAGWAINNSINPEWVECILATGDATPLGLEIFFGSLTQGSSFLAILGWMI